MKLTKADYRAWLLLLAAPFICVGVLLFAAPNANADPATDTAYITVLEDRGIVYDSRAEAIRDGYRVCTLLDAGFSWQAVAAQFSSNSGLSLADTAYVVGAASAAYCGWHATAFLEDEGVLA